MDAITDLLFECFREVFEPWLLPEFFGPVASFWNDLFIEFQRKATALGLRANFEKRLLTPSIGRPRGRQVEGHSLGLMLVLRGDATMVPMAFCELVMMPADGRKPDDLWNFLPVLLVQELEPNAQPYLLNLCVDPKCRRRGLGKAMLRLAEAIVRDVWRMERLFLHADDKPDALSLYTSRGYTTVGEGDVGDADGVVYMCKSFGAGQAPAF